MFIINVSPGLIAVGNDVENNCPSTIEDEFAEQSLLKVFPGLVVHVSPLSL